MAATALVFVRSSDLERATRGAVLSRGLGRSYGDSSLPPSGRPEVVNTTLADRLLVFDPDTGLLRAEAGLTLRELFEVFLAQAWFLPVSPGTWNVTLGGVVAADVHGKNHHVAGRLLDLDFTATVLFCEAARKRLFERGGGGTLCVFGSVAGDRGRKPVVLYGAAKAGLAAYLEGLDHRYHARGLRVVCVKPGFVRTAMTAELKPPPFAGEPDAVAARVLRAIDRGTPVSYAPAPWRAIMAVIRLLPRAVMRRVDF